MAYLCLFSSFLGTSPDSDIGGGGTSRWMGDAGVAVWAPVSPGGLSGFPTLTCTHASPPGTSLLSAQPLLHSFLHVPAPLALPGLLSMGQVWHWYQNHPFWSHFTLTRALRVRIGGNDLPLFYR